MLVVEEKVTKKISLTLVPKIIIIPIYKRKKPRNAHQRSEEKHHGVKEIFDQWKKSKCASRMHWRIRGTHSKESLKNTRNIESTWQGVEEH